MQRTVGGVKKRIRRKHAHDVTKRIFDEILKSTDAHIAVAFLYGEDADPVITYLEQRRVPVIDLRPSEEVYQRDSIAGFDRHPGPVAHYYDYRKIAAHLMEIAP